MRRLFSMFLFAAFLYEVWDYIHAEQVFLTPPIEVGLIQIIPPGLLDHPTVVALNGAGYDSFQEISAWYGREYDRYQVGVTTFIRLSVSPPIPQSASPPTLPRSGTWWQLLKQSYSFSQYFYDIAHANGIKPEQFGIRLFVVYGRGGSELSGESRGSKKERMAVIYINLDDPNVAYAQLTLAHELAHILGAHDLYEEGSFLATWPEGHIDPHRYPLYPQPYAELMAVDIPTSLDAEREVRSMTEARIGYQTAADMGWITQEQARFYYQQPMLY